MKRWLRILLLGVLVLFVFLGRVRWDELRRFVSWGLGRDPKNPGPRPSFGV